MPEVKLSIFASAIRPELWKEFLDSLRGGKYAYEVIFAGFIDPEITEPILKEYPELKYITTENIKPCQCYEVARRACTGTLIHWTADDAVYSEGFIDKVYDYWMSLNNMKMVLSCKTNENGNNETMLNHRFFSRNQNTPIMAPLAVMNRIYLQILGGYDHRYVSGQAENSVVMQVYADGGKVHIYEDVCILIDHKNRHGKNNNFWAGYNQDREQLENSWVIGGYQHAPEPILVLKNFEPPYYYYPINNAEITLIRNDKHEPFENNNLLTISQSPKGQWQ